MFTQNDLECLFGNISQISGCAATDIFSIELYSGKNPRIEIGPGPEFPTKKVTGKKIVDLLAEYLGMESETFLEKYGPKVDSKTVTISYKKI